ncbi:MAG: branched-chain amino acid ABC transporter permease [Clostridiales bacterium]|nr:branched-chain amino acid ABC transporter permease [Clostridiales bacterium]
MKKTGEPRRLFSSTWSRYLLNVASSAALCLVLVYLSVSRAVTPYTSSLIVQIGFNIILAVSLNLAAGFLGQLPLGHAGFMSVGAYAAALFTKSMDLPAMVEFPIGIALGAVVAFLFGIVIGLPALRLKGDYLAIITLGFAEIIRVVINNLEFTGGAIGLRGIPRYSTIAWSFVFVFVTIYAISSLIRSRHGRAILSIREDEIAAEASGISTTYYKVIAFAISAAFAGVAGGLYAHTIGILLPANFGFMKSAEVLVMVVLGGLGSILGSVISATVLTILPELLRGFKEYRMIVYALVLILVMIFKPSGLCGRYDFSLGSGIDSAFAKIRAKILGKGGNAK